MRKVIFVQLLQKLIKDANPHLHEENEKLGKAVSNPNPVSNSLCSSEKLFSLFSAPVFPPQALVLIIPASLRFCNKQPACENYFDASKRQVSVINIW